MQTTRDVLAVTAPVDPVRVVIADHQEFARVGINALLDREEGVQVVGQAGNTPDVLGLVRRKRPAVVMVDAAVPPGGWSAVSGRLLQPGPESATGVIVMTDTHSDDLLLQVVGAGVRGYVLKNSPAWALSAAIRSVAVGDAFLAGPVTSRLFERFTLLPSLDTAALPTELADLNQRETDVLRGIGGGLSNREIARRLDVAENTVKTYVSRVLNKLGVSNRVAAALMAYRLGLVPVTSAQFRIGPVRHVPDRRPRPNIAPTSNHRAVGVG